MNSETSSRVTSEREFFNKLVGEQGAFDPFTPGAWLKLRALFEGLLRASGRPIDSILDVGCGSGSSKQIYEVAAPNYVGIDLSDVAIRIAKQLHPQSDWKIGDATDLPFENDSFSAIAFSSVLHHIPNRTVAMQEAYRVLKPGGVAFAFDPNLLHPAMALLRHPRSPFYNPVGVSPLEKPLLPSQLHRDFSRAGFVKVEQKCISGLSYREFGPKSWNRFRTQFNSLDAIWQHVGFGKFAGLFVATFAVKD